MTTRPARLLLLRATLACVRRRSRPRPRRTSATAPRHPTSGATGRPTERRSASTRLADLGPRARRKVVHGPVGETSRLHRRRHGRRHALAHLHARPLRRGRTCGDTVSATSGARRRAGACATVRRAGRRGRVSDAHARPATRARAGRAPAAVHAARGSAADSRRRRGRRAGRVREALREADRIIAAGPTPEPEHLGSAATRRMRNWSNTGGPTACRPRRPAARRRRWRSFISSRARPRYGEAARKWVLHLASWNPDGPTNFELNCEAAKPMLYRLPRAYDWAYDALSDADRAESSQASCAAGSTTPGRAARSAAAWAI